MYNVTVYNSVFLFVFVSVRLDFYVNLLKTRLSKIMLHQFCSKSSIFTELRGLVLTTDRL